MGTSDLRSDTTCEELEENSPDALLLLMSSDIDMNSKFGVALVKRAHGD